MISLVFIGFFIILYAVLGAWLVLQGIGVVKRKAPSSAGIAPLPYAKLGDPPFHQLTGYLSSPAATEEPRI